jgi:hypothetical protein
MDDKKYLQDKESNLLDNKSKIRDMDIKLLVMQIKLGDDVRRLRDKKVILLSLLKRMF